MFFLKTKNFIPNLYQNSIYDVDFNKLYDGGFRLILIDLDNTLISYDEEMCDEKTEELIQRIKALGFKVTIVSNNSKKRIRTVAEKLKVSYVSFAMKPFKRGLNKAMRINNSSFKETVLIGDQLTTDVVGGNRCHLYVILVEAVKRKSDHFFTRINRRIERRKIKKIKEKYKEGYSVIEEYDRRHYGN